jgi:hypothetical protein
MFEPSLLPKLDRDRGSLLEKLTEDPALRGRALQLCKELARPVVWTAMTHMVDRQIQFQEQLYNLNFMVVEGDGVPYLNTYAHALRWYFWWQGFMCMYFLSMGMLVRIF